MYLFSILAAKLGRSVYYMLLRSKPFDLQRFVAGEEARQQTGRAGAASTLERQPEPAIDRATLDPLSSFQVRKGTGAKVAPDRLKRAV